MTLTPIIISDYYIDERLTSMIVRFLLVLPERLMQIPLVLRHCNKTEYTVQVYMKCTLLLSKCGTRFETTTAFTCMATLFNAAELGSFFLKISPTISSVLKTAFVTATTKQMANMTFI